MLLVAGINGMQANKGKSALWHSKVTDCDQVEQVRAL
jgi:hypothetical protein